MRVLFSCLFFFAIPFTAFSQIVINEVCAANADLRHDPDFFDFPGWIELFNSGTSSVSLGSYYLSDDSANPTKWKFPSGATIPAKGFLIVWCDERNTKLHTNFSIDADGEEIIVSNPSGELDRVSLPEQYINISYGRLADGGEATGYMVTPTPASKNNGATGSSRVSDVAFSLEAGRYSSTQSLTLEAGDAEIRYTTDGSEPKTGSAKYTGPISITQTTTIKAKAFREGDLPSKTGVRTFFIKEHTFTLPVVSLSTKPDFLFSNLIGIITEGTNGIPGPCMESPRNWNQDWDRHAVFELFESSGDKILDQDLDIRVQGGCSRNNPQKSLVLRARDRFGSRTIEHEFFKTKQINNFGAIVLRNGGNDFYGAMMRDGLFQSLVAGEMDIDYLAYQPSIVYLNGEYWGIQNIREKVDADYLEANFGIDRNDVDILETGGNAIEGTSERWGVYMDSLNRIGLNSPEAFAFIKRYIDVQEYINYLTAELYYCNTDWPGNNVKFWRQRSNNGRFRWILWDLDFGMGLYDWASYPTHETLTFATDPDNTEWPNPAWSTLHLRRLLEIPEFRTRLIQTLTTSLSTTFKPERVIDGITAFENNIKTEMPFHAQRWGLSMSNWNYHVSLLKNFAVQRNDFMKFHIADFFGLNGDVRINLSSFPAGAGDIIFNGVSEGGVLSNGFYYRDLPFNAVAKAEPGYAFSHFRILKRQATRIELIGRNAVWKYNDGGTLPGANWNSDEYADGSWAEGAGELGYGDGDESTIVGYGGNAAAKHITTWFRNTINVTDTTGFSDISGSVLFDDGVIVYLNGEEVFRSNLPAGAVSASTLAINQPSETTYFPFTIPKGKIRPGMNVLSAEVHQTNGTSSDLSFDLSLSVVQSGEETEITSTEIEIDEIANSDVSIEAYFVPVAPVSGLVINEFSASNSTLSDEYGQTDDWIEIHNMTDVPIDLAGLFISDNTSAKMKHLIPLAKNGETIVEPGGYKLLWADDDVEQGPLHLGFKLSAEGEEVGLYQKVGELVETFDEIVFGAQRRAASIARIPNATGGFSATGIATPREENVFEVPVGVDREDASLATVYPNPTDGKFNVKGGHGRMRIEVYNSSGKLVTGSESLSRDDEISIVGEPSGIYFVRIITSACVVTQKIIRR